MFGIFIVILFTLSFPCEGQIILPPGGDRLVVAPGDHMTIMWTFKNTLAQVISRTWTFNSSSQGSTPENIAAIYPPSNVLTKFNSSLRRVEIKEGSKLVLRNVSSRYDGTYTFAISGGGPVDTSNVRLFVAKAPTVTSDRDCPIEVDERENVTTVCKGENGNPPATVTWYKDGVEIGDAAVKENTIFLRNVDRTDNGTYKCVAQSYKTFKDEKLCEVIVNFAPNVTSLKASTTAVLRKKVTIRCEASGRPDPTYTITHHTNNGTRNVSTEKTYTINVVKYSDAGSYQCTARNRLGSNSKTFKLTVRSTAPTTLPPTTPTTTKADTKSNNSGTARPPTTNGKTTVGPDVPKGDDGLSGGAIAGIIIGVLVLVLIILFVVWKCKYSKEKESIGSSGNDVNPENNDALPPVYAAVDKSKNNDQSVTYATLDTVAMGSSGSSKRDRGDQPTEYASIADFGVKIRSDAV